MSKNFPVIVRNELRHCYKSAEMSYVTVINLAGRDPWKERRKERVSGLCKAGVVRVIGLCKAGGGGGEGLGLG